MSVCSMPGNPYDGHTLAEALEQAAILRTIEVSVRNTPLLLELAQLIGATRGVEMYASLETLSSKSDTSGAAVISSTCSWVQTHAASALQLSAT